jgi:hypothetical protein
VTVHKLRPGDWGLHRRRNEYGVFLSVAKADRTGDTVLVRFDGGAEENVSRDLLSKVTG